MTDNPEFLYLTTIGRSSGQPREIEIWFTRSDGRYYVVAELRDRAQWVRNLTVEPRVHVRVGGERFAALARIVDARIEPELNRKVQRLSEAKYGWGDGLVVELAPSAP